LNVADRTALVEALEELWRLHSDLRFGQLLRKAVGDEAICDLGRLDDGAVTAGVARVQREDPGREPPPGPYWSTEARDGRTFANGLPRDPARISRLIESLARAWEVHSSLTLGGLVAIALGADGLPGDECRSRLLAIEDGALGRRLEELAP
jgi:hypothetical protein